MPLARVVLDPCCSRIARTTMHEILVDIHLRTVDRWLVAARPIRHARKTRWPGAHARRSPGGVQSLHRRIDPGKTLLEDESRRNECRGGGLWRLDCTSTGPYSPESDMKSSSWGR
jgi:hypothetical protein